MRDFSWMALTTFAVISLLSAAAAFGDESSSRRLLIIPEEESFVKPLGASMVLTCRVETSDGRRLAVGPQLRWVDNRGQEIVHVNGRRYVETTETLKKLYLVNITRSDVGDYKCQLDDRGRLEKSVTLHIYQEIRFERAPANQYLRLYSPGVVQCVTSGQPRPIVSWRFRGSRITTGDRYVVLEDGLQILNATDSDSGNYTCRAEVDEFGNYAERFISVSVNIPPVITQAPGRQIAVQGEEFFLRCAASGTPPPSFAFFKDGDVMESGNRVEINAVTGVVRFRTVNKADEGSYTCTASNNVGNVSATGFIRVHVKAAVLDFSSVTSTEDELVLLRCRAIGDPAPQMTIRKSSHTEPYQLGSSEGGRIMLRKDGRHTLQLSIDHVVPGDASNYSCTAVNDVGQSQRTAVLTVNFGPQFPANHSREAFTWAGVSRNISCSPLAEPLATIEWTRFGQKIVNNDTYRIINTANASYLQVYVREIDQAWIYGFYTCRAWNAFGGSELRVNLQRASVPDAPKSVELTESMPDGVVLTIEPPDEDGGMPVIGYRVRYGDDVRHDVTASGSRVTVKDLQPGTTYLLRITAKNEVGFGNYEQLRVKTKSLSQPYAVVITSSRLAESSSVYKVQWEMVSSGGLPLIKYEFQYKRVKRNSTKFVPIDSDWTTELKTTSREPLDYFELHGLEPETEYQLRMRVCNELGCSNYSSSDFVFHTPELKAGAALGNSGPVMLPHQQLTVRVLVTAMISLTLQRLTTTDIVRH